MKSALEMFTWHEAHVTTWESFFLLARDRPCGWATNKQSPEDLAKIIPALPLQQWWLGFKSTASTSIEFTSTSSEHLQLPSNDHISNLSSASITSFTINRDPPIFCSCPHIFANPQIPSSIGPASIASPQTVSTPYTRPESTNATPPPRPHHAFLQRPIDNPPTPSKVDSLPKLSPHSNRHLKKPQSLQFRHHPSTYRFLLGPRSFFIQTSPTLYRPYLTFPSPIPAPGGLSQTSIPGNHGPPKHRHRNHHHRPLHHPHDHRLFDLRGAAPSRFLCEREEER